MTSLRRSDVVVAAVISGTLLIASTLQARRISKAPSIVFASVDAGRRVLTTKDDFITRLGPFDRAARMKSGRPVSEAQYLQFVASNVVAWAPNDRATVQKAWNALVPGLQRWTLPLPDRVLFVETTGLEEGGAEYTRANAIMLPKSFFTGTQPEPREYIVAHELFHVLSRASPALRDKVYAAIGFQPCGEQPYLPDLAERRLTNPDAPRNDHCIQLHVQQTAIWATPILFSSSARYDVAKGEPFFNYMQMKMLVVERSTDGRAHYDPSRPRLVDLNDVTGFFEQVGQNTKYIMHPEEILADNFAYLVLGKRNLPSPDVQRRLDAVLSGRPPGL